MDNDVDNTSYYDTPDEESRKANKPYPSDMEFEEYTSEYKTMAQYQAQWKQDAFKQRVIDLILAAKWSKR